ncbi:MAG: cytochrome c biogenesis protein CcdA [Actinomycetota bacterium]|nr:cytochrome c biogenesis protein CcdA [Actinomycetota bacterium]
MSELFEARSFALGMVALINPCGFALLPAYLGFFVSLEGDGVEERRIDSLNRAQLVGLSLTLGFLLVFGLIGIVFSGSFQTIAPWLPEVTLVLGIGLVVLGVAMLAGFEPVLNIPKLNKGGKSKSFGSVFLFGISYAIASLSCTLGIFLSAIPTSSSGASFGSRMGSFLSYGFGMGLLATIVTLAVAFGRDRLLLRLRRILPKINLISASVLVVVGTYVILYGIWSIQVIHGTGEVTGWIDAVIVRAENFQTDLSLWVGDRATTFGWVFVIVNAALLGVGVMTRQRVLGR